MLVRATELDGLAGFGADRLAELAREFAGTVLDPRFPCVFAQRAVERDELLYGLVGAAEELLPAVLATMRQACAAIRSVPDQVVVVFLDLGTAMSLVEERAVARSILTYLRRHDPVAWPADAPTDPHDPRWVLWFDGIDLFINFSTPAHVARRSRRVASAFTLIVQSRSTFDPFGGAGHPSRALIRARLAGYDAVPAHPALGAYGDPTNCEAAQYFLGDANHPSCPLVTDADMRN
jgi:FPC/CPF motif-containing protein YcgG